MKDLCKDGTKYYSELIESFFNIKETGVREGVGEVRLVSGIKW